MRLRLQELQGKDKQTRKLRVKQLVKDSWEGIDGMFYYHGLSFVPEIIWIKLISRHHNNLLVGHFGIEKTYKLVA